MKIADDILYVGVNDHEIDLFEGQYVVPNGMAYNSYLILDDKIAVMDAADARFCDAWLANLEAALGGRTPDYLIVQHMEPDHSGSVDAFARRWPDAAIVATAKAFSMMQQFFGTDYAARRVVAAEGSELPLGRHVLRFVTAPMVHWPEVMVTYDAAEKLLFSADAFGKFGALDAGEPWTDEARRYYIGIVGKYGAQVRALMKKAEGLEIGTVCPLHGPVLRGEALAQALALYAKWASYEPEESGVLVAYSSVYGHTKTAAELLAAKLREKGCAVETRDLARCDLAEAVAQAFRLPALVLATTTYNAEIYPAMKRFIDGLTEHSFQNRRIGLIENGSWAPTAAKGMLKLLENSKNLEILQPTVTLRGALSADSEAQLDALAEAIAG